MKALLLGLFFSLPLALLRADDKPATAPATSQSGTIEISGLPKDKGIDSTWTTTGEVLLFSKSGEKADSNTVAMPFTTPSGESCKALVTYQPASDAKPASAYVIITELTPAASEIFSGELVYSSSKAVTIYDTQHYSVQLKITLPAGK